jgi:excinuclease ABC subunit C
MFSDADVLTAALQEFYARREPPGEIHVPTDLAAEDRDAFEGWLSERAGRRVRLHVPQRGEKRALLDLASRNAAMTYESLFNAETTGSFDALDTLRGVLNLPALPRRIECFDISTLQGRETVGSMVVCVDGRMRRSEYRKFRIRGEVSGLGPRPVLLDDFAAMREVVLRRYRGLLEHGEPFPDLILIDGGKGQLTAAYAALRDVGLERLIAVGIAKQEELLFTRDRVEGVALARDNPALRLIQRVRNEAHRVAVTFHRRARRIKQLLVTFGSVAGVRRASREDLTAVVGAKTADAVIRYFGDRP